MSDTNESQIIGECYICGDCCNWMSQTCGSCARKLSMCAYNPSVPDPPFTISEKSVKTGRKYRNDNGCTLIQQENQWWWYDGQSASVIAENDWLFVDIKTGQIIDIGGTPEEHLAVSKNGRIIIKDDTATCKMSGETLLLFRVVGDYMVSDALQCISRIVNKRKRTSVDGY